MHPIDRLEIDTPEQIALELPLAGVGSRGLALAIDTLLQIVLLFVVVLAVGTAERLGTYALVRWLSGCVAPVLFLLFVFCLYWGYFALFEIAWAGQTPGKRVARIRVIKESGRPVNVFEAIGRNLVRAVDFLPAFYGAGFVCMLVDRRNRRLGDFVAGTVVVHERRADEVAQPYGSPPLLSGDVPAVTAETARAAREDLVLIETYLSRRQELDPEVQLRMSSEIAARIRSRAGLTRGPEESDDEFLEAVARRIRENARF